jgi:hypothetical protein
LPVDVNEDVKDEPDACAAEVVAETTLKSEGEVVVPVGSKPAIFIPIAVVCDEMKMQAANELPLFQQMENADVTCAYCFRWKSADTDLKISAWALRSLRSVIDRNSEMVSNAAWLVCTATASATAIALKS